MTLHSYANVHKATTYPSWIAMREAQDAFNKSERGYAEVGVNKKGEYVLAVYDMEIQEMERNGKPSKYRKFLGYLG